MKVEIINATHKKPFLGGFRHKTIGTEYLNASCQTFPKKIISNGVCGLEIINLWLITFSFDTKAIFKQNSI